MTSQKTFAIIHGFPKREVLQTLILGIFTNKMLHKQCKL